MCVFSVHSLTDSLGQHTLIHDIHFSPVDARFVLGSGNTGSRGTVVNEHGVTGSAGAKFVWCVHVEASFLSSRETQGGFPEELLSYLAPAMRLTELQVRKGR